jgi:AraC-like DNA-binding protein
MLGANHLSLASVRLKAGKKWIGDSTGFTFILPTAGVGRCVWPQGSERIEAGDVLVLVPSAHVELQPAGNGSLHFSCFLVTQEHLLPLLSWEETALLQQIALHLRGARVYPAYSQLAAHCHRLLGEVPTEPSLSHRAQLLRIAASVLSFEMQDSQLTGSAFPSSEGRIGKNFDKIMNSLSTTEILTLSIPQLAARFNYCRRHLTRIFHQRFGCSVSTLKMEIRLQRAASLLRNPEFTNLDVAKRCGFKHVGYFSRCFKRRFGSSPGQWRTSNRKAENRATTPPVDYVKDPPLRDEGRAGDSVEYP